MLTLQDLATLLQRWFCKGEGGDVHDWRISIFEHKTLISTNFNSNSIWKFCQKIVRSWFDLTFINGPFSFWCTIVLPAVVSCGLTGQGRRLGFTALRVSYKKETLMQGTECSSAIPSVHPMRKLLPFQQATTNFSKKLSGDYSNWVLSMGLSASGFCVTRSFN
jgi:hypothetical protein